MQEYDRTIAGETFSLNLIFVGCKIELQYYERIYHDGFYGEFELFIPQFNGNKSL